MLYHERERKNKENANFVYIVYLLAKLCNNFGDSFFIDVSIEDFTKTGISCIGILELKYVHLCKKLENRA